MSTGPRSGRARSRSPLLRPSGPAPATPAAPAAHTGAELRSLLGLVAAARPTVRTVTVGHGRDPASEAAALAFAEAWQARGGEVQALVDWPDAAASWLRAARRLTTGTPDAWVVAGGPLGWAQLSRRLRHSTDWTPRRTFGFASLGDILAVELAGAETLRGMSGATPDGGTWRVGGELISYHPADPAPPRRYDDFQE
ncbi:hypothetical protein [Streptacidiphilus sp. P02-A3a]|uniref:hypothetical protein n=1 Tax=Streptacidiphilus sp. P02-A3a TaxID=2704468 RepID=UPI0015F7922F|nr:hypothetical protein [Streptacidiphilus sp. P02-A3a]QMU71563.1 hypothetical protein GXP74_28325 [Streptacidiphilus sp. P02-A3a]